MNWYEVSSVVARIGQLLIEEANYLQGAEGHVKRLQTELEWMQSFLKDADTKKAKDERIRKWISEVRKLTCDAEDVIDTFAVRIASKRKGGVTNFAKKYACIFRDGWRLHKVRSQIEEIITRVSDLTRQLQTYGVKGLSNNGEGSSSFAERRDLRRPFPHIIEDNIVGLDDDLKKLVSVLVDDENSECRVVSICGMGGLGKTTLAKRAYHYGKVKSHFKHSAWIFVSQQFQRKNIWEDILSSFGIMEKKETKKMRDEEITEKLFNFMKEERCLVILDDIWTTDAWDSLQAAFPMSGTASKILLTSRNKEIVFHADRRGHLLDLPYLTEEQSWELLQKIAFLDQEHRVDASFEDLGKVMVKGCKGLPLAIVVLGGILFRSNSLYEWQKVSEDVKSYLNRNKGNTGVEHVLALSYDDLPPYLKPCFLYLSHFPEDYEIPSEILIQLWVAEGIVSEKEEKSGGEVMEDVAERYLVELAERYMIQVGKRYDASSKILTCRMHDLMRDFCLSKAKEENFLCIIEHTSPIITPKARRIAVHEPTLLQCIKGSHLRSILFFANPFDVLLIREAYLNPKMLKYLDGDNESNSLMFIVMVFLVRKVQGFWAHLFNNFKKLRVLHFGGVDDFAGIKLPSAIGNLIHLRFLSLTGIEFVWPKIPSSIGNLRNLQTLDLRVDYEDSLVSVYVPNVIWKLEQLRHLYLPRQCVRKSKLKLYTLRKLQTLVNFNTVFCFAADLSKLINLTKLEIYGSFNIEDLDEIENSPIIRSNRIWYLGVKIYGSFETRNLELLLSSCLTLSELSLTARIRKLPVYSHFPSSILSVHLGYCFLEEDPMPILEKLPNLRILKIRARAFIGNKMVCSTSGFPKLDSLNLYGLENLEEWDVEGGAMPALRHLEIGYCRKLKMLPEGLSSITTLQQLKIKSMRKAFKDKLVGGEDFCVVQHVPSIIFENCDDQ